MNIQQRADIVLQQIDADLAPGPWKVGGHNIYGTAVIDGPNATFISASRTTALRCLKTAIEGMLKERAELLRSDWEADDINTALTTLCEQWEASRV